MFGNFTVVGKTGRSSAENDSFYDDDLYFSTWSRDLGIYSRCPSSSNSSIYISVVQSFILRLERGNKITEHFDCKIELFQNYHDLVGFSVIALIGCRDINVNTDCQ